MFIRQKISLILCTAFFVAVCADAGEKVLFSDNFKGYKTGSDPSPKWEIIDGEWEITEEGLRGRNSGTGGFSALGAAAGDETWKDYILKLKFKVIEVGGDWRDGPWIGFRFTGIDSNYTLGFYAPGAYLHKASDGQSTGDKNPLAQFGCNVMDWKWHTVEIKAEGNHIAIRIDGKSAIDIWDENWADIPPVTEGRIMLSARKFNQGTTTVIFSDVEVAGIFHTAEEQALKAKIVERLAVQRQRWENLKKSAEGIKSEDPIFFYLVNWLKRIEASFKEAEQKISVFEVEPAKKLADWIESDLKIIGQRMTSFK